MQLGANLQKQVYFETAEVAAYSADCVRTLAVGADQAAVAEAAEDALAALAVDADRALAPAIAAPAVPVEVAALGAADWITRQPPSPFRPFQSHSLCPCKRALRRA
ncbi:hypothetical protein K2X33_09805 [bacterium]|nr:hypothetical protein [bacterium]